MTRIAALIMAKNEEKSIGPTLESIVNVVDCLVFWDTGSTDGTLEKIVEFKQKYPQIPVYVNEGMFTDFATSRNESIAYAESITGLTHVLVLDAGDEIQSKVTRDQIKSVIEKKGRHKAFQVQKKWKHGNDFTTYMVPLLFCLHEGCKYVYPVHEYLEIPNDSHVSYSLDPTKFCVFQDRNLHGNSSPKRWKRDLQILLREHGNTPFDPRIQFYLAQTYKCLGDNLNSAKMYKQRYDNKTGFWEERFQAALCVGEIYQHEYGDENFMFTVFPWFMKALSVEMRVEPLLRITDFYIRQKKWDLAFMFVNQAVCLPETTSTLFVNRDDYDYKRYHLMGIVGYYACKIKEGKQGCIKAMEARHLDLDSLNLQFYERCQIQEAILPPKQTPKISITEAESIKEDVQGETEDPKQ